MIHCLMFDVLNIRTGFIQEVKILKEQSRFWKNTIVCRITQSQKTTDF